MKFFKRIKEVMCSHKDYKKLYSDRYQKIVKCNNCDNIVWKYNYHHHMNYNRTVHNDIITQESAVYKVASALYVKDADIAHHYSRDCDDYFNYQVGFYFINKKIDENYYHDTAQNILKFPVEITRKDSDVINYEMMESHTVAVIEKLIKKGFIRHESYMISFDPYKIADLSLEEIKSSRNRKEKWINF
jgi:hypothetical protein